MQNFKNKVVSARNHVSRNRGRYGILAGLTLGLALNRVAVNSWNEFLEEQNLTDEFYSLPE